MRRFAKFIRQASSTTRLLLFILAGSLNLGEHRRSAGTMNGRGYRVSGKTSARQMLRKGFQRRERVRRRFFKPGIVAVDN